MEEQSERPSTTQMPVNRPNGWVVLDKTWARHLGVTRDCGVYRIRHRELLKRISPEHNLLPAPGRWNFDPANTTVGFEAPDLTIASVRGGFRDVSGTILVGASGIDSWVDVTVQATGPALRDEHLRAASFLDSAHLPTMCFRSTQLDVSGDRSCKLTGDLTLFGVTRPVTLDLEFLGTTTDQYGNAKVAFQARASIDREEFGLVWNRSLGVGRVLVGKHIELKIEAQATAA